ncbi:FG-GAP-like repeat-containing protein [Saccharothrix sp. HUAS TT1]|uniref:FG-GAP-like repeat-containing protein n=1 Tax=unclassified Saccharothrix TaxID=2593673 RepID=UPI00345B9959
MPRPESPVDPRAGAVQHFAHDLRLLREKAGSPPYRSLARRAHYAPATLARAASGRELPSLAVALAYVRACGGDEREWEERWRAVAAETHPASAGEPRHEPVAGPVAEPRREPRPPGESRPSGEPVIPAQPTSAGQPAPVRRRWPIAVAAVVLVLGAVAAVVVSRGDDPPSSAPPPVTGKAEMLDVHTGADGTIRTWPNTGGFPEWTWSDPVGIVLSGADPALTRFADLDGDGYDELVRLDAGGTVTASWNDRGFPGRPWQASLVVGAGLTGAPDHLHFADLDGDGRDELVTADGALRARPNTGGFPGHPWGEEVDLGPAPSRPVWFADLDGDAKAELITLRDDDVLRARHNTGAFPDQPWGAEVDLGPTDPDPARVRFADLDGDGFAELVTINEDGTTTAWWNDRTFPDHPWHASVLVGKGWVGDPARVRFADLTGRDRPGS